MTYRAVRATSPTIGRPGPDSARPYRWRRNPDWYPGNPAFREAERQSSVGGRPELKTAARAQRIADFTAAREQAKTIPQAAAVVNVTAKTARAYERERLAAIREALS